MLVLLVFVIHFFSLVSFNIQKHSWRTDVRIAQMKIPKYQEKAMLL